MLAEQGPPEERTGETKWASFWLMVLLLSVWVCFLLGRTWIDHWRSCCSSGWRLSPPGVALPSLGSCTLGWGKTLTIVAALPSPQNVALFGSLGVISWEGRKLCPFWENVVSGITDLLGMQVTNGEPTSGHKDVYLEGTP